MKPIKVIFLDIDGVMNSWDEMRLLISTNEGKPIKDMDLPSKSHMSCLKNIVNKTKAKIVLASSWRISLRRIQTLIDIFEKYNLTIYGYTCEGVDKSELLNTRWRKVEGFKKLKKGITYDRGAEIAYWLSTHNNVSKYVILDDESSDILPWHPNNLVQTSMEYGLTSEEAEKCLQILGDL